MRQDQMCHKVYDISATERIPLAPEAWKDVRYYYAESKLYLFQLPNGSVAMSCGNSPKDAYERVASQFNGTAAIQQAAELAKKFGEEHRRTALSILDGMKSDLEHGYRVTGSLGSLINAIVDTEATAKEAQSLKNFGGAK